MAQIYNEQRVRGVVLVDDGTTMYNGQRVIGVRDAGSSLFSNNLRTLGVNVLSSNTIINNEQPVLGAVLITDGRVMYNGQLVQPAYAVSGSLGGSIALNGASVLDASATYTKVGAFSGYTGAISLTDDAGGRFVVNSAGELRVGLIQPSYASATSHSISVSDGAGATGTFTINVLPITAATLSSGGSVQFPRRNGNAAANALSGPRLYGVFGANVTDGADGTLAFMFDFRRGSLVSSADNQNMASAPYIMGTSTNTTSRGFAVKYFPEDASSTGSAVKGRICIAGKDHGGTGNLGLYAASDTDGTPTGAGVSGSYLRSAVITDDVPRLFILRYTKTGTTWNGVTYGARTFQVLTVRLDTFAIEYGDTITLASWTGMGTSGTNTNVLALGTYNAGTTTFTAPTLLVQNYFSGRLSDLSILSAAVTDADAVSLAKGVLLTALYPSNVQYYWRLSGASDLTQTAGSQTATAFAVTGTVYSRQQMRPSYNAGNGLAIQSKGDGYLYGLPASGSTIATIALTATVTGAATHLQARVVRVQDGALISDWARATASAATGDVAVTIPSIPIGFDYCVECRREDDTSVVAIHRDRLRVGYKFAIMGQSQDDIFVFGAAGNPGTGYSPPASNSPLSFAVQRARAMKARKVDVGVLENASDLSAGMNCLAQRLAAIAPSVPLMIQNHCQSGESLGSFYADQIVYSTAQGGDGAYRCFGDYTTQGSGLVTDVMLVGGKDISFFLHMHGTADIGRYSIYTSLLNALYAGASDGNEVFSNQPSVGGATVTTSIVRHYGAAGLTLPRYVAMVPVQRHAYVGTGASVTTSSYNTFRNGYHALRHNQKNWAPPSGVSKAVAGYLHDVVLEYSTDTAHQGPSAEAGQFRVARRYASSILGMLGITSNNPNVAISGVTRSGDVLTVAFTLPNGGSLFTPSGGAPVGFEVSEDGGVTWSGASMDDNTVTFTAALVGNTVTLTRSSGSWAANTQVRYCYGGPIGYVTASQTQAQRDANFALEVTDIGNMLYESRADAAPSNGGGIVQGVPVIPLETPLVAA